jgi:hypothetical protein
MLGGQGLGQPAGGGVILAEDDAAQFQPNAINLSNILIIII